MNLAEEIKWMVEIGIYVRVTCETLHVANVHMSVVIVESDGWRRQHEQKHIHPHSEPFSFHSLSFKVTCMWAPTSTPTNQLRPVSVNLCITTTCGYKSLFIFHMSIVIHMLAILNRRRAPWCYFPFFITSLLKFLLGFTS